MGDLVSKVRERVQRDEGRPSFVHGVGSARLSSPYHHPIRLTLRRTLSVATPPLPTPLPRLALSRLLRLRRGLCALVNLSNYPYRELRRGQHPIPCLEPTASRFSSPFTLFQATPPNILPFPPLPIPLYGGSPFFYVLFSVCHATSTDTTAGQLPETYFLRERDHGPTNGLLRSRVSTTRFGLTSIIVKLRWDSLLLLLISRIV